MGEYHPNFFSMERDSFFKTNIFNNFGQEILRTKPTGGKITDWIGVRNIDSWPVFFL